MADTVHVLIAHEEEKARALRETLEEWGHEVTTVSAIDEALPRVEEERFDVALVGVGGDDDEALELVRQLKQSHKVSSVIALVDGDEPDAPARALESGADDFLRSPIAEAELRARLLRSRRIGSVVAELKRKEDHGRVMLELTRTLSSSLDFEDILFEVARRIAEVIQVDRCSIVLRGGDPEKGFVVASSEDPGVRDLVIELRKYPEVEKVLADGTALVIDVGSDPLLDEVRSHIPPGGPTTSALFPITHEARPMGVLFLRFKARREELTDRELDFCQTVANATAISLRNARIVSALRDEQARMSHAASEAERRVEALSHYADFFESSADGMLVVDKAGKVLYANPRVSAFTSMPVEKLLGVSLAELVVDEEQPVVRSLLDDFGSGSYPQGLDLRFVGVGGDPLVLSVSASSTVRLRQGVLLILRDVTVARKTEAELRRTTEFLEGLIAHSVDAIVAADMTGRVLLFNPAAERVLGYAAEVVLGRQWIEQMYPPGVAREIMGKLRSERHGGVGRLEQTRATIVAKDGTQVPISMTGGIIYEEGEPRATFGIFTDLRPILQIENDLARTRLELMEREREAIAAQLAGAAAHELNQPLTFVMASVELLRRKLGEATEHGETVDTILAEADRMAQIVRKIGRITHYETKAYVGSTRILDLDAATSGEDSVPPPPFDPSAASSPEELEPFGSEDRDPDTFVGQLAPSDADDQTDGTGDKVILAEPPPEEGPLEGDVVARLRSGRADSEPPPEQLPLSDEDADEDTNPGVVFKMDEDEEEEEKDGDTNPSAAVEAESEGEDTHPTATLLASDVLAARPEGDEPEGAVAPEPAEPPKETEPAEPEDEEPPAPLEGGEPEEAAPERKKKRVKRGRARGRRRKPRGDDTKETTTRHEEPGGAGGEEGEGEE